MSRGMVVEPGASSVISFAGVFSVWMGWLMIVFVFVPVEQ